jgi:predicted nucleotidyltransferase
VNCQRSWIGLRFAVPKVRSNFVARKCEASAVDKQQIISDAVNIIRRHLSRREFEIVLFGSWARGNAQENSDIDLGLVGPESVDDMTLLRIKEEIRCIPTLRRIDVVDLSKTDDTFRQDVLSYAQVL